jgi:hypothetical protein
LLNENSVCIDVDKTYIYRSTNIPEDETNKIVTEMDSQLFQMYNKVMNKKLLLDAYKQIPVPELECRSGSCAMLRELGMRDKFEKEFSDLIIANYIAENIKPINYTSLGFSFPDMVILTRLLRRGIQCDINIINGTSEPLLRAVRSKKQTIGEIDLDIDIPREPMEKINILSRDINHILVVKKEICNFANVLKWLLWLGMKTPTVRIWDSVADYINSGCGTHILVGCDYLDEMSTIIPFMKLMRTIEKHPSFGCGFIGSIRSVHPHYPNVIMELYKTVKDRNVAEIEKIEAYEKEYDEIGKKCETECEKQYAPRVFWVTDPKKSDEYGKMKHDIRMKIFDETKNLGLITVKNVTTNVTRWPTIKGIGTGSLILGMMIFMIFTTLKFVFGTHADAWYQNGLIIVGSIAACWWLIRYSTNRFKFVPIKEYYSRE